MGKILVKYDVRGIQAFVFRTNKLKEIRAVSDLPENIIKESADEVIKELGAECHIDWLDTAGGNALALFDSKEEFEIVSTRMAVKVLEKTYSLKLVYAFVELKDGIEFPEQFEELNQKLGKLKASMPEVTHTGAFPICRQDYLTGFPIAKVVEGNEGKVFLTQESVKKLEKFYEKRKLANKKKNQEDENTESDDKYDDYADSSVLDDLIFEKGIDSHIAVIHIDGNNMGNRISKIIKDNAKFDGNGGTEKIKATFKSITVADSFKKVCKEVKEDIDKYKEVWAEKNKADIKEAKPLIYSVIAAGDDITYVTRANIALPFTKLFLSKISKENMYSNSREHAKYGINACAGIAIIKSHFPFSDAYELAEKCCASAKKRAKSDEFKNKDNKDNPYGSWIDFEICTHIKNVDLEESRKKYGATRNEEGKPAFLHLRPYYVGLLEGGNTEQNADKSIFSFDKFEERLSELVAGKKNEDTKNAGTNGNASATNNEPDDNGKSDDNIVSKPLNRSRAKELRQAYSEGGTAVTVFKEEAKSRKYTFDEDKMFADFDGKSYALYYDATDMMDLVDIEFMEYVNSILKGDKHSEEV